jgi:hypothetical protein
MASIHNVYLPADTIPTVETKIKLADRILVSPLGEQEVVSINFC